MKQESQRRRLLPPFFVSVILLLIYFTYIHLSYPILGLVVEKENHNWIVKNVWEGQWAEAQSIQKGDIIKLVNGEDTGLHKTVDKFQIVEMAHSITVQYPDNKIEEITISPMYKDYSATITFFIPFIFTLTNLFLVFWIYKKAEKSKLTTILIYFLLALTVCYFSAAISARGEILGRVMLTVTFPFIIIFLIHFFQLYLLKIDINFIKARFLRFLYVFTLSMVTLFTIIEVIFNHIQTGYFELFYFLCLLLIFVFLSIRLFIKDYSAHSNVIIKIFIASFLSTLAPFIFFYLIPDLLVNEPIIGAEYVAVFLLIIPITLVYLLMAEKLFNIDFIIARLGYHALLSFPFTVALVLLIVFLRPVQYSLSTIIFMFVLLFIMNVLILYTKEYLDYKFHRHLFSKRNDFTTSLYSFFQKVKNEMQVANFIEKLQFEIKSVLKVREVMYLELTDSHSEEGWTINGNCNLDSSYIQSLENNNWNRCSIGTLVEFENGYSIVIGGKSDRKDIVFITMRRSKVNLNIQEKVWLETLAYFSSILLENFLRIEELMGEIESYKGKEASHYPPWLSRLLFALSEKERANLASDLHDSVLQDQLQFLREIEQVRQKTMDTQMKGHLSTMQERMLDNIHLVRETCNELQPPFLHEMGLIQSLQNLINQTNLRCSFILVADLDKTIQRLEKDVALTLYRVVQELFNNAMEHSEAENVHLAIRQNAGMITLIYQDDGIGFNLATLQNSFTTMGLFGIRERVKSIGGSIQITTAEGEGMSVYIEIGEVDDL